MAFTNVTDFAVLGKNHSTVNSRSHTYEVSHDATCSSVPKHGVHTTVISELKTGCETVKYRPRQSAYIMCWILMSQENKIASMKFTLVLEFKIWGKIAVPEIDASLPAYIMRSVLISLETNIHSLMFIYQIVEKMGIKIAGPWTVCHDSLHCMWSTLVSRESSTKVKI